MSRDLDLPGRRLLENTVPVHTEPFFIICYLIVDIDGEGVAPVCFDSWARIGAVYQNDRSVDTIWLKVSSGHSQVVAPGNASGR